MKNKVIETIKKYGLIQAKDKIVLGVSGGPDSITMLDILRQIQEEFDFEIVVAHINHMIRKEAIQDEEYVKKYCEKNSIEFFVKRIDVMSVANNRKIGTEEAGRFVRYEFFDEILKQTESNKIAIAHNKNDKVETIIMHLLRGSGLSGLKGIEPIRENVIRPLIECERKEIEKYCDENRLEPRIDKTNFENDYTRNKIRNIVIPYIEKELNPNIIETIDRLSEVVKKEDRYLEKVALDVYDKILIKQEPGQIMLELKGFNEQDEVIKSRIILYTVKKLFGSSQGIEKIHINDIIKLCNNNIGNKYLTPNKKIKILVRDKKIFFMAQTKDP